MGDNVQESSLESKPKSQLTPRITPANRPRKAEAAVSTSVQSLMLIAGVLIIVGMAGVIIYLLLNLDTNVQLAVGALFIFPACAGVILMMIGLGRMSYMVQEMKFGVPIGAGGFALAVGTGIAFELLRTNTSDIASSGLAGMICWVPSVILCVFLVRLGYSELRGRPSKEGIAWIILTLGSLMFALVGFL